eukprot:CAMPEP_0170456168 /NCGR_PEP_ID=MMETSP0123-20130129/3891_1 /TAXON_ID=182087 /ORGANISM="Favella ehrenbergii, Strain Fehren 1" /LENGTH=175 /DNA_ID=CAMNT_0010719553 /DNA_START=1755 /DNA_END=2279 /DNA_ORIENTATION=+
MSRPYRQASLKDMQSESKFTDSTSIYRLKSACELKSFSFHVQEAKGYKTVNKLTLYVSSVQDVDIAEMKTNRELWQKVSDLNVDVTQKSQFTVVLPLPVTATHVLIEYHAVNLVKPVEFNGRNKGGPPKYFGGLGHEPGQAIRKGKADTDCESVEGLDPVLKLLPKEVTSQLSFS